MNQHPGQLGLKITIDQLKQYEQNLDPLHPEKSTIPTRVLGYGEISTVLEIDFGTGEALAYKRMPMFKTQQEVESYINLYQEYLQILESQVNLHIIPGNILWFTDEASGRIVAYLIQEKLPSTSIGSNIIRQVSLDEAQKLILSVLQEIARVFDFNKIHRGEVEVAIDGQISNWAVLNFKPGMLFLDEDIQLTYLDTNTPFITKAGKEQANPELFLRSAPSFLVWMLKLLFLKDVMTRYYDFRKVCIDLIANFYKEQRSDLISSMVDTVNNYFPSREQLPGFLPISVKEISDYYQEDAMIWRLYLSFRKIDRAIHRLFRKPYPYILPDKVKR
jgi:hypothetical protein